MVKDGTNKGSVAEGKGFEPPEGVSSFNDLANRRLQPLGHPSAGATGSCANLGARSHAKRYTAYAALYLTSIIPTVKYQNNLFVLF